MNRPAEKPLTVSRQEGGMYRNTEFPGVVTGARRLDLFRWMLTRRKDPDPKKPFPIVRNADLIAPPSGQIQATWIGHSTVLFQLAGMNFLCDPIFSARCSPVQWTGPKRFVEPGVPFEELPRIDVVLISHSHYDHLDDATIRQLGPRPIYLVPKGLGPWMKKRGAQRVREMDWWYEDELLDFKVVCCPAQHFSARTPWDTNKSLWCSWLVEAGGKKFYFGGDSGYFSGFAQIGKRHPNIDLAAIPIGAWKPRFVMKYVHMDPAEALRAFRDTGAGTMLPIHWGTFKLTDEALDQPMKALRGLWAKHQPQLGGRSLMALRHGESGTA